MQTKKLMLILAVLPAFFSCSVGTSGDLNFSLGSKSVVLINNATTSSCEAIASAAGTTTPPAQDVTAVYFVMPQMTITWSQSQALTVDSIIFEIKSPQISNGSYQCTIAGTALMYDWLGAGYCPTGTTASGATSCTSQSTLTFTAATTTSPTGTTTPPTQIYSNNYCPITCGGISLVNPAQSFSGTATVYVYGTYTDKNGNANAANSQQIMDFQYTGNPQ